MPTNYAEATAKSRDPYEIADRVAEVSPELAEELAALSSCEIQAQERVIGLMPLADRLLLEASGVVHCDESGHLVMTDLGREVVDATAIAASERLSARERAEWDARAEQRMRETLAQRRELLARAST